MVALELRPTNKGGELLDINVIASAYGKDSDPTNFVKRSDVLYLNPDIKKTKAWLQSVGLQLPSDATKLGPIGTITYQDGKVKIVGVPYRQYMQKGTTILSAGLKNGKKYGYSTAEPQKRRKPTDRTGSSSVAGGALNGSRLSSGNSIYQNDSKSQEKISGKSGVWNSGYMQEVLDRALAKSKAEQKMPK